MWDHFQELTDDSSVVFQVYICNLTFERCSSPYKGLKNSLVTAPKIFRLLPFRNQVYHCTAKHSSFLLRAI